MTRARDLSRLPNENALTATDSGFVGVGTTQPKTELNVVGVVSATSFYGDGTNLSNTGSTLSAASGTERVVLTSLTTGTMTASSTDVNVTYNATTQTLSVPNVSIAGTLTYEDVTNVDSVGLITARNGAIINAGTATTALIVNGNARVTGILTVGTSSITLDGTNNQVNVGTGVTLHHTNGVQVGNNTLHSTGLTVNNLNVTGISTFSIGAGSTAAPALSPTGDSNTGIFFPAADTIAFAEGGVEVARFDSSSRLLIGTSSNRGGPQFQIEGLSQSTSTSQITRNSNDTGGPILWMQKSRGTTNGSKTIVASGDNLGIIGFLGSDGTYDTRAASIEGYVDGTPGASDMPGRLVFSTTIDGASSPNERWRINNYGLLHNGNGQHAHGGANFSGDYKCQLGIFGSAESGTNGSSAVGSGPFDSTYKNSEWNNLTLTYGMVNELIAEYNLSQASRCNIGAHFYVTNAGGGDYNFPTGSSSTDYWTPNGAAIWARGDGGGGYVGYSAIRADVAPGYASGTAFYARVKNAITSGVGYGYHCDLGGHPFGGSNVGYYVRQIDNQNMNGCSGFYYRRHNTSNTFNVLTVANGSNTYIGGITCTNTNTAFPTSSDYRLKENVVPLTGAIERLKQIPVHRFNFIADPETTQDGFLAHELQPIVPIAVTGEKDEMKAYPKLDENESPIYEEGEDGEKIPLFEDRPFYQAVDYSKVVPLLTAALQEALDKIDALQARLDAAGL